MGGANPYQILLATLISLRTKDALTLTLSQNLFKSIKTPTDLLTMETGALERALYPCSLL
jgi:endonuclease-3